MAKKRTRDGESFKEDRAAGQTTDLHDPPAPEASLREKIEYQRRLRKAWDDLAYQPPSRILDMPLPNPDRWWTIVDMPPPEYIRQRVQRQMRRLGNG